ncbi:DUF3667 domain-containing protein [Lacinutrix sp. MEBiC02404]
MTCKNCDTFLNETDDFCNSCGAKVIRNRLTIKNLFEHFTETFFNYDNKFLQTFIHLFTKPEAVIGCYIDGTRKKYVNVISYFAVSLTVFGLQLFIMNTFFKDAFDLSSFNKSAASGFESPEDFIKSQEQFQKIISNYQSLLYIITIPFTAFATWIAFYISKNRTYNYTEHVVVNLYYSGQVIIVTSLITILLLFFGIDFLTTSTILTVLSIFYLAYIFKRLFNLKFGALLLRILLVLIAFLFIFLVIMITFFIVVFVLIKVFNLDFKF